jgi:carboxypeptidase PM20D1
MTRKAKTKMKRAVFLLLLMLLLLIGVLTWNYLAFSTRQLRVASDSLKKLNPSLFLKSESRKPILERFVQSIQIRSLQTPMARIEDDSALYRFREFIQEAFPSLHQAPFVRRTGKDFDNERIPSILLEWPGTASGLDPILLMSHFDVVPIEANAFSKWSHPPFSGHMDNEFVWGRGTLDCKHGVMAIHEAISKLADDGFRPQRTIYIALGHDEEIGGADGNKRIAAWFRSHGIRLHSIIDEGGCVFNEFPGLDRPAALVGVAEKGFLTVEMTVNLAADKVGHSSMPPRETAVSILASAIHRVQAAPFPSRMDGGLQNTLRFLGPEMPFEKKLAMSNMWLFGPLVKRTLSNTPSGDALLRTTIAPTMIEGGESETMLPLQATAKLNLRLLPGDSIEGSIEYLRKSINDPRVALNSLGQSRGASPVSDIESDSFRVLQTTIHQVLPDVVVAPFVLVGSTDTVHYSDLCENIFRFIPTRLSERDTQRFHGIDERIGIENYLEIISFFHQYIQNASAK